MSNELVHSGARSNIALGSAGLVIKDLSELARFASAIVQSGDMCPKHIRNQEQCLVALEYARELGLPMLVGLQNIAVVNGRPTIWGDGALGLCRSRDVFDDSVFEEWFTGTPYGDDFTAHTRVARHGGRPVERSFSVADAKMAGLWGKQGPWKSHPKRMLQMRARGYALRDCFTDILLGLYLREEIEVEYTDVEAAPSPRVHVETRTLSSMLDKGKPAQIEAREVTAPESVRARVEEAVPAPVEASTAEEATEEKPATAEPVNVPPADAKPEAVDEPRQEPLAAPTAPAPAPRRVSKERHDPDPKPEPKEEPQAKASARPMVSEASDDEVVAALNDYLRLVALENQAEPIELAGQVLRVKHGKMSLVCPQADASWFLQKPSYIAAMRALANELSDDDRFALAPDA